MNFKKYLFLVLLFLSFSLPTYSASIPIPGYGIEGLAFNASTNKLYILSGLNTINVIGNNTDELLNSFDLEEGNFTNPKIQTDNLNNKIIISDSKGIHIIDGTTNSLVNNIPVSGDKFTFNSETNKLWLSDSLIGTIYVIDDYSQDIDSYFSLKAISLEEKIIDLKCISSDKLYVFGEKNVFLINPLEDTITSKTALGNSISNIVFNSKKNVFYLLADNARLLTFDISSNSITKSISLPATADKIAINENLNKIFVVDYYSPNVYIVDEISGKIVNKVDSDFYYIDFIEVDSVNNRLFVASYSHVEVITTDKLSSTPEYISTFKENIEELRDLINSIGTESNSDLGKKLKDLKIVEFNNLIDTLNGTDEACNSDFYNKLLLILKPSTEEFNTCCVSINGDLRVLQKWFSAKKKPKKPRPQTCNQCLLDFNIYELQTILNDLNSDFQNDLDQDDISDLCKLKDFEKI